MFTFVSFLLGILLGFAIGQFVAWKGEAEDDVTPDQEAQFTRMNHKLDEIEGENNGKAQGSSGLDGSQNRRRFGPRGRR